MTALEQLLLAGYTVLGTVIAYLFRQLQRSQAKESAALREILPLIQDFATKMSLMQDIIDQADKREKRR